MSVRTFGYSADELNQMTPYQLGLMYVRGYVQLSDGWRRELSRGATKRAREFQQGIADYLRHDPEGYEPPRGADLLPPTQRN